MIEVSSSTMRMVRRPAISVRGYAGRRCRLVQSAAAAVATAAARATAAGAAVAAAVVAGLDLAADRRGRHRPRPRPAAVSSPASTSPRPPWSSPTSASPRSSRPELTLPGPEFWLPGPELSTRSPLSSTALSSSRLRSGGLTGAARVVGVLGLVAGAGDVLVLSARRRRDARGGVVLRRRGRCSTVPVGGRVVVGGIVSALGRHDDRREDPEERTPRMSVSALRMATRLAPGWSAAFQRRARVA